MVDFQSQTDAEFCTNNNPLNIFFCSIYTDNNVSTYCDLSYSNNYDVPIIEKSVSLCTGTDTINEEDEIMLPENVKQEVNIDSEIETEENVVNEHTQFYHNIMPPPAILEHHNDNQINKCDLNDLDEFLEFNDIEPTDTISSKFKCKACCINLEKPIELIRHVKENHRPTNIALMCNRCPFASPLAYQLQAHKEAVHGRSFEIKCGFCTKSFSETRIYIRHVMIRHAKNRTKFSIRCKTCSIKCKNLKVYRKHQRRHKRESEIDANLKQIYKVNDDNELDLVNSVEEDYTCGSCSFVFDSENALHVHVANKHPSNRIIECKICMKTFERPVHLKQHMARRHGGPPLKSGLRKGYQCHVCLKDNFLTRTQMNHHLLAVHKVKNEEMDIITCETCGKEFACKARLKAHLLIHDPEKKIHTCNICEKSFTTAMGMTNHRTIVHFPEEAKYPCSLCNKVFTTSARLKAHAPVHTGYKSHSCSECGRKFQNKANLTAHVKSIHGVAMESVNADGSVETVYVQVKRGPRKKHEMS